MSRTLSASTTVADINDLKVYGSSVQLPYKPLPALLQRCQTATTTTSTTAMLRCNFCDCYKLVPPLSLWQRAFLLLLLLLLLLLPPLMTLPKPEACCAIVINTFVDGKQVRCLALVTRGQRIATRPSMRAVQYGRFPRNKSFNTDIVSGDDYVRPLFECGDLNPHAKGLALSHIPNACNLDPCTGRFRAT